ncbi:hypothetical protein ES705_27820 [subsurface metagenome]
MEKDLYMKTELYVVYDKVAEESGPIFEARNEGVASRQYAKFINKADAPADYLLFRIGSLDHDSSVIVALDGPVLIEVAVAKQFELAGEKDAESIPD